MAYDIKNNTSISFFKRAKTKLGKVLARNFPLNSVRKFGLRLCGFKVGDKVYIGYDLIVASILGDKRCKLEIENNVAIGPRVTLILSSDANWSDLNKTIKPIRDKIVLKEHCWIGAGVIILPGIIIGKKSVIGAGSVVTKNVNDNTIVAGVPARKIRDIS